jgi:hypothetical protein
MAKHVFVEEQDLSHDDQGAVSNPGFYMDDVGGFNDGKNVF